MASQSEDKCDMTEAASTTRGPVPTTSVTPASVPASKAVPVSASNLEPPNASDSTPLPAIVTTDTTTRLTQSAVMFYVRLNGDDIQNLSNNNGEVPILIAIDLQHLHPGHCAQPRVSSIIKHEHDVVEKASLLRENLSKKKLGLWQGLQAANMRNLNHIWRDHVSVTTILVILLYVLLVTGHAYSFLVSKWT
jgi:hypothetical protein